MHRKILHLQRQIPSFLWINGSNCAAAVKHEKLSTIVAAQEQQQSVNDKEGQTSQIGPDSVRLQQNEQSEPKEEQQEWWKMHQKSVNDKEEQTSQTGPDSIWLQQISRQSEPEEEQEQQEWWKTHRQNDKEGQTSQIVPDSVWLRQQSRTENELEWWKSHRQWRNSPNTWEQQHRRANEFQADLDDYWPDDQPSRSSQYRPMRRRRWQPIIIRQTDLNLFADRPELLFPLIALAFRSNNTVEQLRSLCPQIKASLEHFNSPDRIEQLGAFLKWQFLGYFIYTKSRRSLHNSHFQIEEMATVLRGSGCYPTPLVDAIQHIHLLDCDPLIIEHLYQAFLAEPEERKLFADRPHIFFPWMVRQLRVRKDSTAADRRIALKVMDRLLQMHADPAKARDLPDFMVKEIRGNLSLVIFAAKHGHFSFVQRVMDCSRDLKRQFVWHPRVLLQFALHNWLNGNSERALAVQRMLTTTVGMYRWARSGDNLATAEHSTMHRITREQVERRMSEYYYLKNALNTTNQCFRELMENPWLTRKEREKYSRIFLGYVRDVVYTYGLPKD